MVACENAGHTVNGRFQEVLPQTGKNPKGGRPSRDFQLDRYACYLIAQNASSSMKQVAFAQGIIYLTPEKRSGSYLPIGRQSASETRRYEMAYIAIEWIHGRPNTGADQDEARASASAEKVLDAAGVNYAEAEAEYQRQWLEFDDEAPMTGLALNWIAARQAADIALTEGWHNTDSASCSIMAG